MPSSVPAGPVVSLRPDSTGSTERLRQVLEALRKRYGARHLATDPLQFVHRYEDPRDQEVVGLIASSLAFGRAAVIRRNLDWTLAHLGRSPSRYVERVRAPEAARSFLAFRHRWIKGRDVVCLLLFMRQMIERSGSLGGFFHRCFEAGRDIRSAVEQFSSSALSLDHGGTYRGKKLPRKAGVRYFFPLPSKGSACKRLNLFVRWMVRSPEDGLDLGLWSFIPTSRLVMPLDTHIHRIGVHLGWTRRKTPGWQMAADITRALAEVDSEDPTKYDFCLSRLGMLEGCPRHPGNTDCALCALRRRVRHRRP